MAREDSDLRLVSTQPYPGTDYRVGDPPWLQPLSDYSATDWGCTRYEGTINDYAFILNSDQNGMFDTGTNEFAVSGWFKLASKSTRQTLFAKYSGGANIDDIGAIGFSIEYRGDLASKALQVSTNDGEVGGFQYHQCDISSGGVQWLQDDEWHHLFCVIRTNKVNSILIIDALNVFAGGSTYVSGTLTNTGDFKIGQQSGTGTGYRMIGKVCMVSFWVFDDITFTEYARQVLSDNVSSESFVRQDMALYLAELMYNQNDYSDTHCRALWYRNHDGTDQKHHVAGNYLNTVTAYHENDSPINTRTIPDTTRLELDEGVVREEVA